MKKSILLIALVMLANGLMFGKGAPEDEFYTKINLGNTELKTHVRTKPDLGFINVTAMPMKQYTPDVLDIKVVIFMEKIGEEYKNGGGMITDINQMPSWIRECPDVYQAKYIKKDLSSSPCDFSIDASAGKQFKLNPFGKNEILFLYKIAYVNMETKYFSEYFDIEVHGKFFKDEPIILDRYFSAAQIAPGKDQKTQYEIQCACFMSIALFHDNDELRALFNTVVKDKMKFDVNIGIAKDSQGNDKTSLLAGWLSSTNTETGDEKKQFVEAVNDFKIRFSQNFVYVLQAEKFKNASQEIKFTAPFPTYVGKFGFDSIYGDRANAKRNNYISFYLMFLFTDARDYQKPESLKAAQPLYSYLLWDLNKNDQYDYRQYQRVDANEGKSIAEAALKYLSWGVEYTPYAARDSIALTNPKNLVFGYNQEEIKNWLNNPLNTTYLNNYFPGLTGEAPKAEYIFNAMVLSDISHIMRSDITTDKLTLAGRILEDKNLSISKIDFWSSANLAWEDGIVSQAVSNIPDFTTGSSLYDKKRDTNCILTQIGTDPIEIGYTFKQTETIKAVLLIGDYRLGSNIADIEIEANNNSANYNAKRTNKLDIPNVTATSYTGVYKANNVKDNNTATRWQSTPNFTNAVETQNLTLELSPLGGEIKIVESVTIDWDDQYAKKYEVQTSLDNQNWTKVYERNEVRPLSARNRKDHYIDVIKLSAPTACRFIRIVCLEKVKPYMDDGQYPNEPFTNQNVISYSIWEIGVSGLEFKEYHSNNQLNSFRKRINAQNTNDAMVEYKYYILDTPLQVNQIRLHLNGVAQAQIQEILVFPENPIEYVTSLNKDEVRAGDFLKTCNGQPSEFTTLRTILFNTNRESGSNFIESRLSQDDINLALGNVSYTIKQNEIIEVWHQSSGQNIFRTEGGLEDLSSFPAHARTKIFNKKFYFTLNFNKAVKLDTIVLWETVTPRAQSSFSEDLIQITANNSFFKTAFFSNLSSIQSPNLKITTPFKGHDRVTTILGNPLPYAPLGMDSPRTFAYKMYEQFKAMAYFNDGHGPQLKLKEDLFLNTTLAIDQKTNQEGRGSTNEENYNEYSNEIEMHRLTQTQNPLLRYDRDTLEYLNAPSVKPKYSEDEKDHFIDGDQKDKEIRPYLPGFSASNDTGYRASANSMFCVEKNAGVDSVGILLGAVAMSSVKDSIVDFHNVQMGKLADQYFSMKKISSGDELVKPLDGTNYSVSMGILDNADGKPRYYPDATSPVGSKSGNLSDSDTHFRMTMKDIERNTVLVPDISLIQPGDLLVQYNTEDREKELKLGIVVGLGWKPGDPQVPSYGEAADLWWDAVYVVSVRPGMQQVTLGTWGNPNGMFGGFSENPESCQIRRLLKVKNGITALSARGDDTKTEWEIVKETLKSLTCEIKLPNNWDNEGTTNHWIPNTSEGLGGIKVLFTGTNETKDSEDTDPKGVELPLENYDIVILPPEDQFFSKANIDVAANQKNNTRTNKGTGIEIWIEGVDTNGEKIIVDGNTTEYLLATFKRKEYTAEELLDTNPTYGGDTEKLAKDFYRDKSYNADFFDPSGKGKNGFRLHTADIQVNENGSTFRYKNCLVFDGELGGKKRLLYRFRVKVINDKHIYLGDDFLLRFKVYEIDNAIAAAKEKDFLAVYDHKFLWRANLYLDEAINSNNQPTNRVDWNDLFPWDSSENLWNQAVENSNHGHEKGGQVIEIKPWSQCKAAWEDSYIKWQCYNSVAYTGGAVDSVYNFNDDMDEQKACLNSSKNGGWTSTLAPDNDWYQYDDTIRGTNCPYRPGYSITLGTDGSWAEADGKKSAGLDCGGFVVRCANYNNSIYMFKDQAGGAAETRYLYNDAIKSNPMYEQYRKFQFSWSVDQNGIGTPGGIPYSSWALDSANNYDGIGDTPPNPKRTPADFYFRYLVPGDIVLFRKQAGGNHIAIIHSITYDNGRTGKYDDVILIESTCYDNMYCIQKRNSIQRYINSTDMYSVWLRRIKIY